MPDDEPAGGHDLFLEEFAEQIMTGVAEIIRLDPVQANFLEALREGGALTDLRSIIFVERQGVLLSSPPWDDASGSEPQPKDLYDLHHCWRVKPGEREECGAPVDPADDIGLCDGCAGELAALD